MDLIARREIVHVTVESLALAARDDVVLVPVTDLPPMPLGLIWARAAEHERIRAMAALSPPDDATTHIVRQPSQI